MTLIEVLVVITVVGLLMALLMSAVQAAREGARRADCASRMRNIGLALHQHVEARGTLPGGYGPPFDASYLFQILPYLEQQALYNAFNLTRAVECNENSSFIPLRVSTFTCPSDSQRSTIAAREVANYAGNAGSNALTGEGVFIGRPLALREVRDGLSQTVGVTEWVVGPGNVDFDRETARIMGTPHRLGTVYMIQQPIGPGDRDKFVRICTALSPDEVQPGYPGHKSGFWTTGGAGSTQYNHTLPPNRPSCTGPMSMFMAYTAASFHGGGANALMLDGGVRFVKESVDPRVWSAVGSRSGGEVVGGDAL
jgi:prepilin-type processing-associated H-X9-DG protein